MLTLDLRSSLKLHQLEYRSNNSRKTRTSIASLIVSFFFSVLCHSSESSLLEQGAEKSVTNKEANVTIDHETIESESHSQNETQSLIIRSSCTKNVNGSGAILCRHSIPMYTSIEIKNNTTYTVGFKVDEYHSHCGFPGSLVGRTWQSVYPSATLSEDYITYSGRMCREKWIVNCKLDGIIPVSCSDVLDAAILIDYR